MPNLIIKKSHLSADNLPFLTAEIGINHDSDMPKATLMADHG